ncbi:MAG: DUF1330 domain-containing protein [Endomicrobiaceae bacterium]|nr:DUF1330 domain-containing protein [Endomicrobiaceae bacterium]
MSVYFIVEIKEIYDKEKYMQYVQKVPAIVEKFGGKYIVRGGKTTAVSGDWNPLRLIVIDFESIDKFNAWWKSSEYRAVVHLREESAKTNAVVIEGIAKT